MNQYRIETDIEKFAPLGTLLNSKGYNPYRDELGRFASGPSSKSASGNVFSYNQDEIYTKNELGFPVLKQEVVKGFSKKFIEESEDEYYFRLDALANYQNDGYRGINSTLRKGAKLENTEPILADTFDMSFNKGITVYRGEESHNNHWDVKVGSPAPKGLTNAIVSTSLIPEVAESFASQSRGYETFITMKVKKGTKCVIPQMYTGDLGNEAEIMFPPNTKMIVKSINIKPLDNGITRQEIELEVG